ncbi:MAG: gamma-glutamyl-gamma-aminobutyrate hydrolase family protein [Pseudomonadota bacterium]
MAASPSAIDHDTGTPIIGITGCHKPPENADKDLPFWYTKTPYINTVFDTLGAAPLLLAGHGDAAVMDRVIDAWLDTVDGILVTGSPSNVEPHHYKGVSSVDGTLHDPARDGYTLPLIRRALEQGVPLLAICRGHQELNVALGGSLNQHVQDMPGHFDHRPDPAKPITEQFGPAHMVHHRSDGFFMQLMDCDESLVNSYHEQAIDRLAPGLREESTAPDGTIEAVSVKKAKAFALGIQWHPEWDVSNSETSQAIFRAFREACLTHQHQKLAPAGLAASA